MSEENKELSDKAENATDSAENLGNKASEKLDDAKEKANEFADEAKEKASEFADEAKEKASEFADDVKKEASEFKENVKETFGANNPDSGKSVAIIAHLTLIGWVIALVMNNGNKTEIGSFYIRQVLGIMIMGLIVSWIPLINIVGLILVFTLWIISLVGALGGKETTVFLVGDYFQDWFKSL